MKPIVSPHWLMLATLTLSALLTACASEPQPPMPVACPTIPPLSPQARQPAVPEICQPTCSEGLARLLSTLQPSPTSPTAPASTPSSSTTH